MERSSSHLSGSSHLSEARKLEPWRMESQHPRGIFGPKKFQILIQDCTFHSHKDYSSWFGARWLGDIRYLFFFWVKIPQISQASKISKKNPNHDLIDDCDAKSSGGQ